MGLVTALKALSFFIKLTSSIVSSIASNPYQYLEYLEYLEYLGLSQLVKHPVHNLF